MYEMLDAGKLTVFITGATSGFGLATARRFGAAGANVVATGRRLDRLVELQNELGPEHCHVAALNVREKGAIEDAIAGLPEPFSRINVVVANAGLALGLEPAYEVDIADWEQMIETNVMGLTWTVRALLPGMVARGEGHVVTIGSIAGDFPYPGGSVYGGTKAFVKQFALNLRADLQGKNVRVTNIEPGMVETEFSLVRFKGDDGRADKVYEGMTPMTPEDIAESIFWAVCLPRHVNINRIQMMPVEQAFSPFAVHRGTKA